MAHGQDRMFDGLRKPDLYDSLTEHSAPRTLTHSEPLRDLVPSLRSAAGCCRLASASCASVVRLVASVLVRVSNRILWLKRW